MVHRKDLLKKGYRSWWEKGTKLRMEAVGKKFKKQKGISDYVVAKCLKGTNQGKYELYVK